MSELIREEHSVEEPMWPAVNIELAGQDGNAGSIMGRATRAVKAYLRECNYSHADIEAELNRYRMECFSGNYDELLRTTMCWVRCDDD